MGYDLQILRGDDSHDNPAHQITEEEWFRYIESDPDLRRPEGDTLSLALLPPRPDDPVGWPWLRWCGGRIFSKTPDERTVLKMLQIASHFGGYVKGDDQEIYSQGDDGKVHATRK